MSSRRDRTARNTSRSGSAPAEPTRGPRRAGPADGGDPTIDPLEAELESTVRSMAEEGAVAKATGDRIRADRDRTWQRALTARERRDALIADQRRLVTERPTRTTGDVVDPSGQGSSPAAPKWPVAAMKAEVFKALAHPARVRVLELLAGGEYSVGRIADLLGMEISHLSHQLAVLRRAALVDSRREGSVVIYSVRQPQLSLLLTTVAGEMLRESVSGS